MFLAGMFALFCLLFGWQDRPRWLTLALFAAWTLGFISNVATLGSVYVRYGKMDAKWFAAIILAVTAIAIAVF